MAGKREIEPLLTTEIKYTNFVDEYFCNGFNVTKAYQKVYHNNDPSVRTVGYEIFLRPEVQAMVKARQKELKEKNEILKHKLVQNLLDIIDMNMDKTSGHKTAIKAIEVLNRMHGFNEPERTDLTSDGQPLLLRDLVIFTPAEPEEPNNDFKYLPNGKTAN